MWKSWVASVQGNEKGERMKDFADGLSPLLVKELRQGLRSRMFLGVVALSQVVMVLVVLQSIAAGRFYIEAHAFLLGFLFLLILPVRGLTAVAEEVKAMTLELLLLTQLSPWRIALGKWLALCVQSFLILVMLLPYMTLLYFTGSLDLVKVYQLMAIFLAAGWVFTAVAVALSAAVNSVLLRVAVVPFALWLSMVGTSFGRYGSPTVWAWSAILLGAVGGGILVILGALEWAAVSISPEGEKRVWGLRCYALAITLLGAGFSLYHPSAELVLGTGALVAPVCLSGLWTRMSGIVSVYSPPKGLKRWPVLAKLLAWFLYPGVISGLLFFILISAILLLTVRVSLSDPTVLERLMLLVGGITFPAFIARKVRFLPPMGSFLAIQAICFFVALAAKEVNGGYKFLSMLAGCLPPSAFWLSVFDRSSIFLVFSMVLTLGSLACLLIDGLHERRMIAILRASAAAKPERPAPQEELATHS